MPPGSTAATFVTHIDVLHGAGVGAGRDGKHSPFWPLVFALVLSICKRMVKAFPFPLFLLSSALDRFPPVFKPALGVSFETFAANSLLNLRIY